MWQDCIYIYEVGVNSEEGPPVPIPNTVVKLFCAENTWRAAAREDKATPTFFLLFNSICLNSSVGRARGCYLARGLARPVDEEASHRAGRNTEQCEAHQASSATMFLTDGVTVLWQPNKE